MGRQSLTERLRRTSRSRYPRDAMAPGRWVNPLIAVLGALVLSGYLMTGPKSSPDATAPVPPSDEQLARVQVQSRLAYSKETGSLLHSSAAQDKSTSSSTTDLMKAAFGATLALAWAVFGAWFGARRAREPNPLQGPAAYPKRAAYDSLRSPTCERMYDETRLVPQYLRSAEFPTTKRDLLRLAEVHPVEGLALRRLEGIPDRCYSSLHDLITEIRVD